MRHLNATQQTNGPQQTEGLKSSSSNLSSLRELPAYLAPYKAHVLGAFVAVIVAAGTVLALGQGLRTLIDEGFGQAESDLLNQALMVMLGIAGVMASASFARYYLISWLGERVVADLRQQVFAHLLRLSPAYYEDHKIGNILSSVTTDTTLIQAVVGNAIPIAVRNTFILLGGGAFLLYTSPKLTGVVIVFVPAVIALVIFIGRRVRKLSRHSQDKIGDVSSYLEENLSAISTVQAFGHEEHDRMRFQGVVEAAFQTARGRITARAFLSASVILFVFLAITAMLWLGAVDVFQGNLSAGELASFVFYAVMVASAVGALSDVLGEINRAAGAMDRLKDLLATEPDIAVPAIPARFPEPLAGRVEFRNVTFTYPSQTDGVALENFSATIEPGETIAFAGPSGAGKSTLFKLLLRFYTPQEGDILIDGVSILKADPADVRRLIGVVSQDPAIFSTTALDNIAYGRPDASREDILAAAKAAGADSFIQGLPQGYDTYLGEKGVRLSGGQKQRLAIARALLRDPAILLLDEATSALDAQSEAVIQDALETLMAKRTTLMISHRLSAIQQAKRIYVIDHGQLVDTGTHDALVSNSDPYRRFVNVKSAA